MDRTSKNQKSKARNAARKEKRRKECLEKDSQTKKVAPAQRIKVLDARLGVNVGAKKERLRLNKKIESALIV